MPNLYEEHLLYEINRRFDEQNKILEEQNVMLARLFELLGGKRMSRQHHYVKILPEYYIAVDNGTKTFEIRFNDRNYKVGDILHLQEFCGGQYTSRELTKEICYMIDSPDYCKEGFVVLGIRDM